MKLTALFSILLLSFTFQAPAQRPEPDVIETRNGPITVQPVQHGTFVLSWDNKTMYVDPNGGASAFNGIDKPDMILITDIHGDHLNLETLEALNTDNAVMVVPEAVAEKLPESMTSSHQIVILDNGESTDQSGISIKAMPMYNLPEDADSRHPKGRGNGYLLRLAGKDIYISGDTEGIPEMRSLEDIDVAFVCMNLPYTMDVRQAADAVLDFKPQIVYPYHYRGQDTETFKKLVNNKNSKIEVRLRDWYPES